MPITLPVEGSVNNRDAPRHETRTSRLSDKKIPLAIQNADLNPFSRLVCKMVKKAGPNMKLNVMPARKASAIVCQIEYSKIPYVFTPDPKSGKQIYKTQGEISTFTAKISR